MKKMATINSFIMIVFILFSCQKKDMNNAPSVNNENDTLVVYAYPPEAIDLNNDNIADFTIEYTIAGTDDEPQSTVSISGKFLPENDNKLYYESATGYLFAAFGDTITLKPQDYTRWTSYGADIISVTWDINEGWDSTWTVHYEEPYYLAFILNNEMIDYLGWMELSINSMTGKITINDYFYKESEFIITGNE